ncbi:hypothetical protein GCM10011507_22590 [Edaphobacter acidisoli]|uniref:Uncharacterized protein n=1 Tax=Edaphobacter acidisoli TaxID=2040573 RepID=A0A916W5Y2_9BACT|nr:hypothetical protein [Edaphobacter acidisoli]GGA70517.1 hypothetical protein GCM10011507_22590 [Edaphobacter acidisoli]
MDILERYLQAIAEHLPARTRQDTIAELRANLLAEIEAREEQLGRALTEDEAAKILEAHGMPIMVAARYQPQHSLIGPAMFPIYWYTLKKSFPLVVLAYAAIEAVRIVLQGQPLSELPGALAHFWTVALIFWAIVTLGFAVFEYLQQTQKTKFGMPHWSVRDLPKLKRDERAPSLFHDIADVIVSIAAILWLLAVPDHPYLILGPGARYTHQMPFSLSPEWHVFYWQIIALLIAMATLKGLMLSPGLRSQRSWIQLAVQALGIGIPAIALQMKPFFVPTNSTETIQSLVVINDGIALGFKIAIAIASIKLVWDLWQAVRSRTGKQPGFAAIW